MRKTITKPLHLPALGEGATCPVSPARRFDGGAGFSGPFTAVGPGPLYLADLAGDGVGTVGLSGHTKAPEKGSWWQTKVIWVVAKDYPGPLLLRGGRIDGPGELRFAHYIGATGYNGGSGDNKPHPALLYVRAGLRPSMSRDRESYPSGIYVKSPGCYAVQVDGIGFSKTLVFRVTK